MADLKKKLLISLLAVVIFLIVSLPVTYKLTNMALGKIIAPTSVDGCPTTYGLIVHTVVFFLLTLATMYIPWGKMLKA